MSFWQLNDGTTVDNTNTTFDAGGGNLDPIPDNTSCIAAIEEAKWDSYEGDSFINLKWRVMRPAAYANRVLFQKLKVYGTAKDKDPKATADKAKRMLAAIDANCGGKLMALGRDFEDADLMIALVGKPMAIKVQVWQLDDKSKSGNWISAVAPAKAQSAAPAAPAQAPTQAAPRQPARPAQRPAPASAPVIDALDDDIPF